MKKILFILAAGVMVSALIIGCGTEDPWSPDPARPLELSFVAGPADTVAYGSTISYTWTSKGGSGEVQYQYRLGASGNWSTLSNVTSVTYPGVISGNTFYVRAEDETPTSLEISRTFSVGTEGSDSVPPTVWIADSPIAGAFVAIGENISFTWEGYDSEDGDNLLYWYSWLGVVSDTSSTRTVSFANVQAADPAEFMVWAMDHSGNASAVATISFAIKDASILYVDDYQWYDAAGNIDMVKERDQKQFYRDVFAGYAFHTWDISIDGVPTPGDLVSYSTVVWCSDSEVGSSDGTWADGTVQASLDAYLAGGGRLLVAGAITLTEYKLDQDGYVPTHPGDFEYEWLGVDTSDVAGIDTTWWEGGNEHDTVIVAPDSVTVDTSWTIPWDYWWWLTWVVKDPGTGLDLPDSMKIDVAKQSNQDDYAVEIMEYRDDATVTSEVIFTWGLWVDGDPPIYSEGYPHPYEWPVGHLTTISGTPTTAMLNFDTYSLPLADIRQTFQTILSEFGE